MIKNKKLKNLYEKFLAEATGNKFSSQNDVAPLPLSGNVIDHTLLKADSTFDQVKNLCREAREHSFKTVCLQPMYIKEARKLLRGSGTLVITVIGFPLGANTTKTKIFETKNALTNGAQEIDLVWNIAAVKNKQFDYVYKEICEVVKACKKIPVKVIVETSLLTFEEKIFACACVQAAGATFIKTSTGFSSGGAQLEDIKLFQKLLGDKTLIKASGGIKSAESAKQFLSAGAHRLGTSSGVEIMKNKVSQKDY